MLALRSERFARSVKESLTIQKCQVEFFVAMPVNMDIRANLTLTFDYMKRWGFDALTHHHRKQLISAGGIKRHATPHCFI